jgi:hypothetical protein
MAKLNKDLLYEQYLAHDYGDEISTDTPDRGGDCIDRAYLGVYEHG